MFNLDNPLFGDEKIITCLQQNKKRNLERFIEVFPTCFLPDICSIIYDFIGVLSSIV